MGINGGPYGRHEKSHRSWKGPVDVAFIKPLRDCDDGLSGQRILQGEVAAPSAGFFSILGQYGFCGRQGPENQIVFEVAERKIPLKISTVLPVSITRLTIP